MFGFFGPQANQSSGAEARDGRLASRTSERSQAAGFRPLKASKRGFSQPILSAHPSCPNAHPRGNHSRTRVRTLWSRKPLSHSQSLQPLGKTWRRLLQCSWPRFASEHGRTAAGSPFKAPTIPALMLRRSFLSYSAEWPPPAGVTWCNRGAQGLCGQAELVGTAPLREWSRNSSGGNHEGKWSARGLQRRFLLDKPLH